jgi:hypothetical protein
MSAPLSVVVPGQKFTRLSPPSAASENPTCNAAQNFLAHLRPAIPQCGQQRQCAFLSFPHHLACESQLTFMVRFAGDDAGNPLAGPGVEQLRRIFAQQPGACELIVSRRAEQV